MSSRNSSPLSSQSRSASPQRDAEAHTSKVDDLEARKASARPPLDEVSDKDKEKEDEDEDEDGEVSKGPKGEGEENEEGGQSGKVGESSEPGPSSSTSNAQAASNSLVQGDWQAVWSPQHNMYYFFNMRTNETTWTNPLENAQTPGTSQAASRYDPQAAAEAQGIDPALAYLDPTLAAGPSGTGAFTYAAKFNMRTGAFAKSDARNPEHVSEYERMRRMNSVFFDMDAWQQDVDQRAGEEEEAGKKRKKPTKKDLDMYKERKRQKKLAKTAWLRT